MHELIVHNETRKINTVTSEFMLTSENVHYSLHLHRRKKAACWSECVHVIDPYGQCWDTGFTSLTLWKKSHSILSSVKHKLMYNINQQKQSSWQFIDYFELLRNWTLYHHHYNVTETYNTHINNKLTCLVKYLKYKYSISDPVNKSSNQIKTQTQWNEVNLEIQYHCVHRKQR